MAKRGSKDLIGLVDEWAPTIEKTINQMADKGPKLLNKGRKIAKSKGAKVPKANAAPRELSRRAKAAIVLGGLFGTLGYMAVRRLFGGGDDWQSPPSRDV